MCYLFQDNWTTPVSLMQWMLFECLHAGCTVTRCSVVQPPRYVFRSSFSLLSAQKKLLGEGAPVNLTGSVENFRFEVVHSPQFRGNVSVAVACLPSLHQCQLENG